MNSAQIPPEKISAFLDGELSHREAAEVKEAFEKGKIDEEILSELQAFSRLERNAPLHSPSSQAWTKIQEELRSQGMTSSDQLEPHWTKTAWAMIKHPLAAAAILFYFLINFHESKHMLANLQALGSPQSPGLKETPPVVKWLLVANTALFVALWGMDWNGVDLTTWLGLVPATVLSEFRIWQFFTYFFVHTSLLHLVFNLLFLYLFGREVEKRWTPWEFLIFYFAAGVISGMAIFFLSPAPQLPTVGASGAVFAVMAAYGVLLGERKVLFFFVIPLKARTLVFLLVAFELAAAVLFSPRGMAHFGHLGGALTGLIYAKFFRSSPPSSDSDKGRGRFQNLEIDL